MTISLPSDIREAKNKAITDLVDAGFALIPLMPGTKSPYSHDWQDRKPDPLQTPDEFPYNYGVVLRDDLVVVDVDPRQFQDGRNSFYALLEALGMKDQVLDTYTVRSREGNTSDLDGLHLYFRKPKGISLRTKNKEYPGIEVKSYGSQLVGPGSVHPDTLKPYTVLRGHPSRLLPCPPHILQWWARTTTTATGGTDEAVDDEYTRSRFRDYLGLSDVAVEGAGGDNLTFYVACQGKDFGLTEEAIFEEMRDHWNPRCAPPWPEKELARKVHNAYAYSQNTVGTRSGASEFEPVAPTCGEEAAAMTEEQRDAALIYERDRIEAERKAGLRWDIQTDKNGQSLKNTITNVLNFFRHGDHGTYANPLSDLIRMNMFTYQVEFARSAPWHRRDERPAHWRDIDTTKMVQRLSDLRRWCPPEQVVIQAVNAYSYDHQYHPVRDYLRGLEWDGIPRLDQLFPYYTGTPDGLYERAVSRCFLIACVARVMRPGCQHDHVPILEGKQGTGKSSFCRVLGGPYYGSLHIEPSNKDTLVNMAGIWIAELSEFICARKSEANAFKAFISTTEDIFRKPYGRISERIPRQIAFIATINPEDDLGYLKDTTGNRRFWPLRTSRIRLDELTVDRDQLFAEAFYYFKAGEPWHLIDEAVIREATAQQYNRAEHEAWEETITLWLEKEEGLGHAHKTLTRDYVAGNILNIPARDVTRITHKRISVAMQALGWRKMRATGQTSRTVGYRNPAYLEALDDEQN
jgi:predicted P-loop ATPase